MIPSPKSYVEVPELSTPSPLRPRKRYILFFALEGIRTVDPYALLPDNSRAGDYGIWSPISG